MADGDVTVARPAYVNGANLVCIQHGSRQSGYVVVSATFHLDASPIPSPYTSVHANAARELAGALATSSPVAGNTCVSTRVRRGAGVCLRSTCEFNYGRRGLDGT